MPALAAIPVAIAAVGAWLGPVGVATIAAGAASAGAAVYAANKQSDAAGNALKFAQNTIGPYAAEGQAAAPSINGLLGIGPNGPDPNVAQKILAASPDYQFAQQQGQLAVDRKLASTGLLNSGAAIKDSAEFNQGLATQTLGNYFNRLMSVYQSGQGAATSLTGAGTQAITQQGQAQASGAVGAANALGGLPQNLLYGQLANSMNNKTTGNPSGYATGPGTYSSNGAAASGALGFPTG